MLMLRRIYLKITSLFRNPKVGEQGMSTKDIRVAAKRAYGIGDHAEQFHRDERGFLTLAQTAQDFRYTCRQLWKSKGFTLTAILMLALGIGGTTSIFSLVEAVLLRPLPFPHSNRVMILSDVLYGIDPKGGGVEAGVTSTDIFNYTRYTHSFSSVGAYYQYSTYQLSGVGNAEDVKGTRMSNSMFSVLEVDPFLGRIFSMQEDDDQQHVVVLSYGLWKSRFHGDTSILGTKLLLNRIPYIVIGVMPRSFEFPLVPGHLNQSQLWVPLSLTQEELTRGAGIWHFNMIGRLKSGISPEQAQVDAQQVAQETMRTSPPSIHNMRFTALVRPLHDEAVQQARPLLKTLFFAVVIVLAVACANLAGLLLVRAIQRRREIAVRLALGARPASLVVQPMIESLLLSLTGGAIGFCAAALAIRIGVSFLPDTLPAINKIQLDPSVAAFALVITVVTGMLCGIAPAYSAIRANVNDALKEGGRTGTSGGSQTRLRSVLVIGEIATALILLTASGLLLRSFAKERSVALGFQPDHVLTAAFGLSAQEYSTQASVDEFNHELLRRLRQLPGVISVGMTSLLPLSGDTTEGPFVVDGYVPPNGGAMNLAWPSQVSGDYFRAMGIQLIRGRLFADQDNDKSQLVVIVNRKLAEHFWPGVDPIGKRLRRGTQASASPWLTVLGEVDDVKQTSPDASTIDQIYQPVSQQALAYGSLAEPNMLNGTYGYIILRTSLDPSQMENTLRDTVRSIDNQLPLAQMQTTKQLVADSEAPRWFNTALISSFAVTAFLLAVLGIYSVIAYSVAVRRQEIAIRIALGCQRSGVVGLILAWGAKLAALGCVLGLIGAAAASYLLQAFLFGVSPFDPTVLLLSSTLMFLFALLASALPARRAARIQPIQVLRGE
jgi:putative ABC transport system permease protein